MTLGAADIFMRQNLEEYMQLITSNQDNTDSLFDQIKKIDEQGNEYWLARELMPMLGYQQWRQFSDAIERATAACENIGQNSKNHFLRLPAKNTKGRPREDFKLSRNGSYLTAMNCDPRKPEVAAAQNYFAFKTREAELAPQTQELIQQLLEKIEQQNQVIEAQGQAIAQLQAQIQVVEQHSQAIAQLQSQIQTLLPPSADFIPPGWDTEVWRKLPSQDKRHFRLLHRRRRFRPDQQRNNESLALPPADTQQLKQKQKDELQQLVGEVSAQEKQQLEAAKLQALREFWSQAPEEDQRNMPF